MPWIKLSCVQIVLFVLVSNFVTAETPAVNQEDSTFAALPFGITSFGAARIDNSIFVYGGHTGTAHSYSVSEQSNQLHKLDLDHPDKAWDVVGTGERLQGLALVPFRQQLICVGGFQARNDDGEEQDLHSVASVRAFDLKTQKWSDLAAMPSGRSSHDAIVLDETLYVVGGWNMSSPKETVWHETALSLDLSDPQAEWNELPKPPFERRALAVAAHHGKLFVIGGMSREGGPTRDVEIYDPQARQWTDGPAMLGENGMAGFGAAAWSVGNSLVVSGYTGDVQVLAEDESQWAKISPTDGARFFHRLLPLNERQLLSVGGANMESGKFLTPEIISLP